MTKLTKIFVTTNSQPQHGLITNDNKTIYEDEKDATKAQRELREQGYHNFTIKRTEPTGDTNYYITAYRPGGEREEEI